MCACRSDCHVSYYYAGDGWLLDTATLRWKALQSLADNCPRLWHTSVQSEDGDILVFGGCSNNILSVQEKTVRPKLPNL